MALSRQTIEKLTDEELIDISQTEPSVFSVIFDRYEQAFLRKARSILGDEQDSLDVVQDTFVRIYTAGRRFKIQEGASFSSWGYKILIRQCFTLYQKRKRYRQRIVPITEEMEVFLKDCKNEGDMERMLIKDEFIVALSKLPLKFKRAIEHHFIKERSQKEIAKEEGITEGALKVRIYRAKIMLKKLLDPNKI